MPSPTYKELPITWEKGLVLEVEDSMLEAGQASEILNWEPTAQGSLRARNAFESISTDGLPSTYNVRGFGSIAVGTGASSITGPQIIQTYAWPNGNQDPVATKTASMTGCTVGNILVAIVTDDSGETPTVTAGWTERAVGAAGGQEYVKFYTKTVTGSSHDFAYTIVARRIRSVTVHEIAYLDAESPGIIWAVDTRLTTPGGSATLTVNPTDTDGGLILSGYLYDGGTPATTKSGTSGYASNTQDNANTRTTVQIEDLDQLDSTWNGPGVTSLTTPGYTTPSWTPPTTGILLVMVMGHYSTGAGALQVSGNSLTWNVSATTNDITTQHIAAYAWADLSLGTPTTGSITITFASGGSYSMVATFFRLIGADPTTPIGNTVINDFTSPTGLNVSGLENGSAVLALFQGDYPDAGAHTFTPTTGTDQWDSATPLDSLTCQDDFQSTTWNSAYYTLQCTNITGSSVSPDVTTTGLSNSFEMALEIQGTGSAAKTYHGTYANAGSAIEGFDYAANKRMTAKMAAWGYTPPDVIVSSSGGIDFYIVVALANSSTEYRIYRLLRDEITSGTWELIDQVTDLTSTSEWVSFGQGAGSLVWSSTSLSKPRAIQLNPLVPSGIADLEGLAGRAVTYHKDRMFVAGGTTNPSRIYFSGIGTPATYTIATDYLDIGGDDGEAIQGIVSVEGLLLIAKTNRIYLVSGSGIESFFVNELSGGSAAQGLPAVRTPYGTVVAGNDDVWVVQGGGVDPLSRPLGGGYEIAGNVSVAYAQDSAWVADATTGEQWRINLVTGAWSKEEVLAGAEQVYSLFSLNGRLYYGTTGSTAEVGGTRKLTSDRNVDETTGTIVYGAATGKTALLGPSTRYTPRHLFMQVRKHDLTKAAQLTITVSSDIDLGEDDVRTVEILEEVERIRVDLGRHKGAAWVKVALAATSGTSSASIDVERAVIGADVEAIR